MRMPPLVMVRSLASVTPPLKLPVKKLGMFKLAPPLALMVPPLMVPPLKLSEPVVALMARVLPLLFRTPVRLVAPPVLVSVARSAVPKAPPRLRIPLAEESTPVLDQLPAVVRVPPAVIRVPGLVQLVPVTVMTPAPSALMAPWLTRPWATLPTLPAPPCTSTPAPRVSVPAPVTLTWLATTLEKNTPPVVTALPTWVRAPPLTKLRAVPLPIEERLTRVLSCRVKPPVTLRMPPLVMVRSLASVTPPVKLPVAKLGTFKLAPPLVVTVPPATVPPLKFSEPVVVFSVRVVPALFRVPVRVIAPLELARAPGLVNVPARARVPPWLARVPLLIQFVPLTVMV